jgi:phage baseplate assembly protein W
MIGISPKFPLMLDNEVGAYSLNKTVAAAVQQNFKNLLLTAQGERIMDPQFGVGLRHYLFEPNTDALHRAIGQRIREQVGRYMNFVQVEFVDFSGSEEGESSEYLLKMAVHYNLGGYSESQVIEILADPGGRA